MSVIKSLFREWYTKRQVKRFIAEMTKRCRGEIHIDCYRSFSGLFMVWHNRMDFEIDPEFQEMSGELIGKYFYDKDIWDVAFGYDEKKTQEYNNQKR